MTVITVQRKTLVAVGSGDGGTIISNVYHIVNTFEGPKRLSTLIPIKYFACSCLLDLKNNVLKQKPKFGMKNVSVRVNMT